MRFAIEADGNVSELFVVENTLPDCTVVACLRDAYTAIRFPRSDGGRITVVYPVMFSQASEL